MSRNLRFWKNSPQLPPARRTPSRCRATTQFRPQLEPLEDRLTPVTLTWFGTKSESWSDPRNWLEGVTPYMTTVPDDLIFPFGGVSNHDGPPTHINSITFRGSDCTITGGDLLIEAITSDSPGDTSPLGATHTMANGTLFAVGFNGIDDPGDIVLRAETNDNLIVRSTISGRHVLARGSGTVTLLGNNSHTGATNVASTCGVHPRRWQQHRFGH
jgi:hypothetical protein